MDIKEKISRLNIACENSRQRLESLRLIYSSGSLIVQYPRVTLSPAFFKRNTNANRLIVMIFLEAGNGLSIMALLHSNQQTQIRLSLQELQVISQEINQNFAPTLVNKTLQIATVHRLAAHELRDISVEISRVYAPNAAVATTELVLLPIDPNHLYAYWNIPAEQMPLLSKKTAEADAPLTLRIYSQPQPQPQPQPTVAQPQRWFDLPIHTLQTQQAIQLPTAFQQTTTSAFTAVIGRLDANNSLTPLVQSNTLSYVGNGLASRLSRDNQETCCSNSHYLSNTTASPGTFVKLL